MNKYILNFNFNIMKTNKTKLIIMASAMIFAGLFTSCGDDDSVVIPVDFTELSSAITEAATLITSTNEGTAEGNYQRGSQDVLQIAIDAAQAIVTDGTATQEQVDNAVVAINLAIADYGTKIIEAIDPTNLSAHWTFDEGTGTSVADFSGNGLTGTFMTGHADMGGAGLGGGEPAWAADRYGNANKAIAFDKGAWIEVPYNAAINPSEITISVWVKANIISGNNRFLGLHSWNGYKFQLQDTPKSFFTAATVDDGIYDRDTDPILDVDTWYNLAVTFGGGKMTFYINGEQGTEWDTPGALAPVTGHNLAIGVGSSQYADVDTNYDVDKIIPVAWGGFFNGTMDELRIYKTVLSASQIATIYEVEKP
jgi:hypothetical protein